jgi:hypothetical protein
MGEIEEEYLRNHPEEIDDYNRKKGDLNMPVVKGIKKGKTIVLLEDLNLPDGQEVLVEVTEVNDFWSSLQDFRKRVDLETIDDDTFKNLRDKSTGRDISL